MPIPPMPQIARPMMSMSILIAPPQIAEPTSKMRTFRQYSHFVLNCPYTLPQIRFVDAADSVNATLSQGSLSIAPNCAMIAGCTSATIVLSSENKKMELRMAKTTRAHFAPWMSRGGGVDASLVPVSICVSSASLDMESRFSSSMVVLASSCFSSISLREFWYDSWSVFDPSFEGSLPPARLVLSRRDVHHLPQDDRLWWSSHRPPCLTSAIVLVGNVFDT